MLLKQNVNGAMKHTVKLCGIPSIDRNLLLSSLLTEIEKSDFTRCIADARHYSAPVERPPTSRRMHA